MESGKLVALCPPARREVGAGKGEGEGACLLRMPIERILVRFQIDPPGSVSLLGRREKDNIRLAAERIARSQSADNEMIVLRSEQ